MDLLVRPCDRRTAENLCLPYPTERTLPKSSKYHFTANINGRVVGFAAWGWGQNPRASIRALFGQGEPRDYLELCRFYLQDGTPPNAESQFLAQTIRLIFRYLPHSIPLHECGRIPRSDRHNLPSVRLRLYRKETAGGCPLPNPQPRAPS